MKIIDYIFKVLENITIKKALKNIKKNHGKVSLKMYVEWTSLGIVNSISKRGLFKEQEIEFTNGSKSTIIIN